MGKTRIIGYDVIRIISAFMVVAIHSNACYLYDRIGSFSWFVIMELTALCVVAVPLFFMVSGATNLCREPIEIKSLYTKKIPKQFIPFLIWSAIYIVARIALNKIPLSFSSFASIIWEPAYYQFWFMYTLLGLYICIPVFQLILEKADKRLLQYIIALWVLLSVILPTALRYIPGFKISSHFEFGFLEGYWGYFFLGGYLRKYPIVNGKKIGAILAAAGVAVTGICSVIEYFFTDPLRYYGHVYSAYLLPGAAMAAVGLFLVMSECSVKEKYQKNVESLSGLTLGVYYVHCLVLFALQTIFDKIPEEYNLVMSVASVVSAFAISAAITAIIKKIPKIRDLLV